MKTMADRKRSDRVFSVGDSVYVKLQPYRQQSLAKRVHHKLSPKFYGPFEVEECVGKVAYRLKLPAESRIHPTFHVSQLKKSVGSHACSKTLPVMDSDGILAKVPVKILARRMSKRGNHAVTEVLVQWSNSFEEDATWMLLFKLQKEFPEFDTNA